MSYAEYQDGKQQGRVELACRILNMIIEGQNLRDVRQECENILDWEEDENEET